MEWIMVEVGGGVVGGGGGGGGGRGLLGSKIFIYQSTIIELGSWQLLMFVGVSVVVLGVNFVYVN